MKNEDERGVECFREEAQSFSLAMIACTERMKSYHRQFEERLYSLPIRRPDGKAEVMMEAIPEIRYEGMNLTDPTFFLPAPK